MKQRVQWSIWSLVFLLILLAGLAAFFALTTLIIHLLMEV